MKGHLFAFMALLTGLGSCSQNENMSREETREAIIVRAILERCSEEIGAEKTLLLNSEFSAEGILFGDTPEQFLVNLESESMEFGTSFVEAARDFVAVNFKSIGEGKLPAISFSHVWHSEEDWQEKNQEIVAGKPVRNWNQGWVAMLSEHPDGPGFISLSRVGLSEDKTVAFIYLEVLKLKGKGCSGGNLYVFILVNGEWVLSEETLRIGWIA